MLSVANTDSHILEEKQKKKHSKEKESLKIFQHIFRSFPYEQWQYEITL